MIILNIRHDVYVHAGESKSELLEQILGLKQILQAQGVALMGKGQEVLAQIQEVKQNLVDQGAEVTRIKEVLQSAQDQVKEGMSGEEVQAVKAELQTAIDGSAAVEESLKAIGQPTTPPVEPPDEPPVDPEPV